MVCVACGVVECRCAVVVLVVGVGLGVSAWKCVSDSVEIVREVVCVSVVVVEGSGVGIVVVVLDVCGVDGVWVWVGRVRIWVVSSR